MLSVEQKTFLNILSDYLNCKESNLPNCDVDILAQYAKSHQLEAIVCYQARLPELQSQYALSISSYVNRKRLIASIRSKFISCNIPFLIVKGTELALLYPHPEHRSMVDSDILVHDYDKLRAHEALVSLGIVCDKQGDSEWYYHKNGIGLELHHELIYDGVATENKHRKWAKTVWENSYSLDDTLYHINPEFHLVF